MALVFLAILALPILGILLLVWVVQARRDIDVLREDVRTLRAELALATIAAQPDTAGPDEALPSEPVEVRDATEAPTIAEAVAEPAATKIDAPVGGTSQEPVVSEPVRPTRPVTPGDPYSPPKAVVFTASRFDALMDWLKTNWIYVVSAVSLAFAGLFLVEYGIETGVLTPAVRVLAALALGAAFIVSGEYVRRRWGEREDTATSFIPSVFSGAGLIVLFGSVLAALHLYALVTPGVALAGLVVVSLIATVLGWYTGALMAALGLIGAFVAPFVVGGSSDTPEFFFAYFGLIAVIGLAIDTIRRWAWVSVLALVLLSLSATWLAVVIGDAVNYVVLMVLAVGATMTIPVRRLWPNQDGSGVFDKVRGGPGTPYPEFPTRLVAGMVLVVTAALIGVAFLDRDGMWIAAVGLSVLFLMFAVWAWQAPALEEWAVLPALGLVALPWIEAFRYGPRFRAQQGILTAEEGTPIPTDVFWLVAVAAGFTLLASWRAWTGARWPVAWAAGAALVTPATIAALEVFWDPSRILGEYSWGLVAIGVAGMMTAFAVAFAPRDGEQRPRVAAYALSAISMIAFALSVLLTDAALTAALAVTTLVAALIDRQFRLKPLSVFVQAGAILISVRLLVLPGLPWAWEASYLDLLLAYLGSGLALGAALLVYARMERPLAVAVLESVAWSLVALFATLLLARIIDDASDADLLVSHWSMGLMATVWIVSAAAQLWRRKAGGALANLRGVLGATYGAIAGVLLAVGAVMLNPVHDLGAGNEILGAPVLNTLLIAYLVPALFGAAIARWFIWLGSRIRQAVAGISALLAALWLFLTIRHLWRGDEIDAAGFTAPELYTYTMVLLVIGAALLWRAIARQSGLLRKIGMGVIAVTIAKVFFVDMSGLVGLLRVFSFLALGLALAGLAVLNRWAARRIDSAEPVDEA